MSDKIIIAIITALAIAALLGIAKLISNIVQHIRKNIEAKKRFLEIEKENPEIFKAMKNGLKGKLTVNRLRYNIELKKPYGITVLFGKTFSIYDVTYIEKIKKSFEYLCNNELAKNNTDTGADLTISEDLLKQIKKWGHLK